MRSAVAIAPLLVACLAPQATVCSGGGVCPPGLRCLEVEGVDACVSLHCGDGLVDAVESCDDGNNVSGDGCRFDCRQPCGDGTLDLEEACDDGNTVDGDGCSRDCGSTEQCGNRVTDLMYEACDDGNRRDHDGCSSTCRDEHAEWVAVHNSPVGRVGHAVAFDAARGRLVLFGGCSDRNICAPLGDTWEWDGSRWLARTPSRLPPARTRHAMAYDHARRRVVMFGGCAAVTRDDSNCGSTLSDTWVWDGIDWTLQSSAGPSQRTDHAMAYDAARALVVMFGGVSQVSALDDTWTWDGANWAQPTSITTRPSARSRHAMAYDPVRGRIALFGGRSQEFTLAGDSMYEWDGQGWAAVAVGSGPTLRTRHVMAYAGSGSILLVGGCRDTLVDGDGQCVDRPNDAWAWNGQQWTQVDTTSMPVARVSAAAAYDTSSDLALVIGGDDGTVFTADVWERVSSAWRNASSLPTPSSRFVTHTAYDARRGVVVVHGGEGGSMPTSDTWEWNGRWTLRTGTAPSWRRGAAMVYDGARGRVVLFGGVTLGDGIVRETWEYDGVEWIERMPVHRPFPRFYHAMAYDAARERVVMFGGQGVSTRLDDVWEWDGNDWTQGASGPAARSLAALTYDVKRGRTVLYGGSNDAGIGSGDLWEWDGSTWSELPSIGPAPRNAHALAYDPLLERSMLFSGQTTDGIFVNDTWTWDGAQWSELDSPARPPARGLHSLTYDTARSQIFLFGGEQDGPFERAWTLQSTGGPEDRCDLGFDVDGDGLIGCADPDCAGRCDPLCATYGQCTDADRPRCGDGACSAIENCRLCADDCGACVSRCGDFTCDPSESCTSDCP